MEGRTLCTCGCSKELSRQSLLWHARGEGPLHITDQHMQRRGPIPPARPNPRTRSPGDIEGPPRKRRRVSEAHSLREIYRTSGAANIAGPSTSTGVADQMMDTTASFDDIDMPTESVEDSNPESNDPGFDDRPKSQSKDDGLPALGDNEEANRPMVTFNTVHTSRGGTVLNINRDYIAHINFNLMPGWVPPETMNQIFQRARAASRTPSLSVDHLRRPSEPPSDQITNISVAVDPFYDLAIHSVNEIRVMVSIVQNMMANPMLCSSKDLPETLASLKRLLTLMELALRAYRHTDLVHSLSNAISVGVEECRQLLDELISNLTNFRHHLSSAVLYLIQKYMWARIGWQGSAIHTLDTKLRKSHSSFAACLLALGRAAWPELKRGRGQETLDELAKFYVQLEQESTSLRHISVDAVILQDHLGRELHVPMIFCASSQDFHIVITGFCRGLAGDGLIQQGNYRILDSEDDQVINPEEFAIVLQPGMAVGMSIVLHEQAEERQGSDGYSCPRCQHINGRCAGWVTCAKCNGLFKISPEEESIVSPQTEQHAGTDTIPDEIYLFRKISIFQVAARINDRESLAEGEPRDSPTSALPDISSQGPGSDQSLGGNLHGPGLIRARYAPKPGRSIPDINVEPPADDHAQEMQSNQGSSRDGSPFMQGYPQETSRSGTQSRTFSASPTSNVANWGSPASSESVSNHVYAYFHDDTSDNSISPSNELFDLDEYLNLGALPDKPLMSPQWSTSQDVFISMTASPTAPLSPFTHQSVSGSPYSINSMSPQGQRSPTHDEASSPTSSSAFDGREMALPTHLSQPSAAHRSSRSGDGLLLPPAPAALRRSHSRGSVSSRGHQYTSSDAESMAGHYPDPTLVSSAGSSHSSQGSGGSDQFLGGDIHGPGLIRARSAPGHGPQRIRRRAGTPYERPKAHSNILGAVPPDIPAYSMATGSNSRNRHIASHLGEKRPMCSKPGCGQLFNSNYDRKRHEMRDKHAETYTPESTSPRPGIEPLLRRGLSIPRISVEPPTDPHSQEMQWDQGSYQEASPFMQGYHSASGPQEIPMSDTQSHKSSGLPVSPGEIGKGSLASSESCFSNPSSPANQDADFHDESEHDGNTHISPSNELFDLDEYLNLSAFPDVPLMNPRRRTSPDVFTSVPGPSRSAVLLSALTHQSVSYGYPMDKMSLQGQRSPTHDEASSLTPSFAFDSREMTLPTHPSQRSAANHSSRSGDDLLLPPSPTAL